MVLKVKECYNEAATDTLMNFLAQGMLGITRVSLEGGTLFESEVEKKSPTSFFPPRLPVWDGCL